MSKSSLKFRKITSPSEVPRLAGDNSVPRYDVDRYRKVVNYKNSESIDTFDKRVLSAKTGFMIEDEVQSIAKKLQIFPLTPDQVQAYAEVIKELFTRISPSEIHEFSAIPAKILPKQGSEAGPVTAGPGPLPDKAPKMYSDRPKGQSIIDFLRAEYGPWLDGTLTRPDLKRLDPSAYMALANWLRNNELPEGVNIPTKKEHNDALLQEGPLLQNAVGASDEKALRFVRMVASRLRRGTPTPK